jgi:hypothetical protein
MIKCMLNGTTKTGEKSSVVLIGLSPENIQYLNAGKPVLIKPDDLPGLHHKIMIAAGRPQDLIAEMRMVFPDLVVEDQRAGYDDQER